MVLTDFESFRKEARYINMPRLMKLASELDLSSCEYHNYMHLACNIMKQDAGNTELVIMQTGFDFEYLFRKWQEKDDEKFLYSLIEIWAGWYNDSLAYQEGCFMTQLNEFMKQKKIIFVFLDFHQYIIHNLPDNPNFHESSAHSTSLVFYPNPEISDGSYNLFHFNPHGQAGIDINEYEMYKTRSRLQEIPLEISLDRFILSEFVRAYNTNIHFYRSEHILLHYKPTKYYTYVGPNLQIADTYGICYAFPFLLFHELCYSTYTDIRIGGRRFPSVKNLLKRENIHKIIFLALSRINSEFGQEYLKYQLASQKQVEMKRLGKGIVHNTQLTESQQILNETLENILEVQGKKYLKTVFYQILSYVTQKQIKEEEAIQAILK